MLVQFVIMGSRPSAAYFSDDSSVESIHLDINSGCIQHDEGIYRAEVEIVGVLPPALVDKLLQYRGTQVSSASNLCFSPDEPFTTTSLTLLMPSVEMILVRPELIVARTEFNEGTNLAIEMAKMNYRSQMRYFESRQRLWPDRQPRDREAIGNTQCAFNALSRYLRCAVRPEAATCDGCRDFEERA